jgi:hypothetical protein
MRARAIVVAGLSASLAVAAVAGQSSPQPPPPTFKAEVEYVEVDTLVLDKDGAFVRNLAKEDFRIFEDGKPQKISTFALVDIPSTSAAATVQAAGAVDTDVQSNERPFDGRVYVLILDDLHTQFSRTPRTQAAARQFIEQNLAQGEGGGGQLRSGGSRLPRAANRPQRRDGDLACRGRHVHAAA